MKYLLVAIAAGALGTAGATAAQPSGPTVATPEQTIVNAPKKAKRVCRERQRSGSHLSNIVCKTPEQWAQLDQDQLDTEAEYGIPGNKTASGRAVDRGVAGGSPGHRPGPN